MSDLVVAYACVLLFAGLLGWVVYGLLTRVRTSVGEQDELADQVRRAEALPVQAVRQITAVCTAVVFLPCAVLMSGKPAAVLLLLVLCVAGCVMVPKLVLAKLARHRQDLLRQELPDALDMVANSLRAGLTLRQALARNLRRFPEHVAGAFARVLYDTRLGYSLGMAFDNMGERLPIQDVRMVVIASKIGVAHGGNLAESYGMLSDLVRDSLAFENELRAMTTEGRMQALVMSCLPFALLLILLLIRREIVLSFFTTTPGLVTLMVMTAMQVVAYLWIRKIVDVKV